MKAPDALMAELLAEVKGMLYPALPESSWFAQMTRVKRALTLPAAWLEERKVELPAARYEAILRDILATIKGHGKKPSDVGPFPCAYLHACIEAHLRHHGDEYYEEGKGIRNRVKLFMGSLERAKVGEDGTVKALAAVHAALDVGKRKAKVKAVASPLQPDLFGGANPKQIAKLRAPKP